MKKQQNEAKNNFSQIGEILSMNDPIERFRNQHSKKTEKEFMDWLTK